MGNTSEVVRVMDEVGGFFVGLFNDLKKAKQIFDALSPEIKSVFVPIFQAAVSAAGGVEQSVAAEGLNFSLDAKTTDALLSVISQAKAGVATIQADLKALGIHF